MDASPTKLDTACIKELVSKSEVLAIDNDQFVVKKTQTNLVAKMSEFPRVLEHNDDGIWKRIKIIPFTSKFCCNPKTEVTTEVTKKVDLDLDHGINKRMNKHRVHFTSKYIEYIEYIESKIEIKKDENITKHFNKWAPVLLSMLVDIAFQTQGKVTDCEMVTMGTQDCRNYNKMVQTIKYIYTI